MLFKIIFIFAALYLFALVFLYFSQRNAMYFPSSMKPDAAAQGDSSLKEINVTTKDGLALYGWHRPPLNSFMPTIVWFHGNASNVATTVARARPYLTKGYGLLAVEYRGYGLNPGTPTEQGLYHDGRAFIEWLKSNGTDISNIILYGESIGSGPAVQLATEYPIHILIVDSGFSSAVDAAANRFPLFPVSLLLKDRYENADKIKNIQSPYIHIHGSKDFIIPYKLGLKLFESAPQPKTMITVEGGGHNDLDNYNVAQKILSVLAE